MSFHLQTGAEGSVSESVHFPPISSIHEHQGNHVDGRMAMAPPVSSVSRAPSRELLHDDGRRGPHCMHGGGFDHPEYDYGMRRHSYGDHLGLHSGTLLEQLLLQENQKALRIASLVQSQASGCLSGCLSCGLNEKRLRLRDSEERITEEQRCYSRNVGEGPSRSVNLGEADAVEYPDGWFRQPRPRQSIGGVGERRGSYSEEELGCSLYQERRVSYPVAHPSTSHSQASHHVHDQPLHPVSAAESSVPIYGFRDADGRVRQRWPIQRQSHSGNGTEDDGWHRSSISRLRPASAREQDRPSLSGLATGSLPGNLVGSPHSPAGDSVRPAQSTRTTSNSLLRENSAELSYQDNALQQGGTQRVVTQGPVSLTDWYIIKVQIAEGGRILETKVAVGGLLVHNREHIKTSPIVNRLDIRKVVTEDGVEVTLEGTIDKETSIANGFPPGIVQCLCAGFPYMWKQLLRVRSIKESSDLAVSESLGGLHPKVSKCLSEDESQGINGPKTFKVVPEGMPCSSRDCEGDSSAPAMNKEPLVIQTSPNTESAVDATAGSSSVIEATVSAMAKTSTAVETGAMTTPSTLDPVAPRRAVCEAGCLVEVATRAETSDAIEAEAAVIARADESNAIETQCSPQDVFLHQIREASLTRLDSVPATLAPAPTTEATALATEAPEPAIEAPAPVSEAPVEYLAIDSLSKEAETRPIIDTTSVTVRSGRKNKKGLSQPPVRSSRRLQQRQYCSPRFSLTMVDSLRPVETVQVISGMNLTADNSREKEPAQIAPNVKQDQIGREELSKSSSIIEEVLRDLRQADTEALDQCGFPGADSVDIATDPQPMEVEESGQVRDHCENLPVDTDGFEGPKRKEIETTQIESEGVETEETALVAPSLETERIGETAPVAPTSLVNEEMEESAPITPELLQSKVQSRIASLSKPSSESAPQGSEEHEYPEFSGRLTRSLKRRLKLTPIAETAADVAPGSRSLKRLRRLSGSATPSVNEIPNLDTAHQENTPIPNTVAACQEEGRSVEPDSNPNTPHLEEVDAFYVRARGKIKSSNVKAVSCSNCKQPCSPQGLLKCSSNVVSSEVTPEEATAIVLKVERVDYPTLPSQHTADTSGTAEQLNRDQTGTCTMKRRSGRFKEMKPANRFVNSGMSRKFLGEDISKGSRARRQLAEDSGNESKERMSLGENSRKGSSERRLLGEDSRNGSEDWRPLGENSRKRSSQRRLLGEHSRNGSIQTKLLGKDSAKGSKEKKLLREDSGVGSNEGLRASSSRGKSRRTSILPPPLPPPRVQDKSKVPEAFGLKTSRSGRLLVPPLAFWRSQSIEYDKDGGIIAIFNGFQAKPADTGCFNFTPPQEKNAKRIQERLCKAAATVEKRK